jgi:hypothetical protein
MAVMWPRMLPPWVRQDPRRKAECEVYDKLELVLADGWSVYYSRPWWGINARGGEIDGEADFVVAHADAGVLFIEVKGGLVRHDPTTSRWTSRDRLGITHNIKDPVQQAMKSKHELLKKFRANPAWPTDRVRLRHGVILPDSEPEDSGLVAGYEQELFCFSTVLRDRFLTWLSGRLASHADREHDTERGPGMSGIAAIDETIAAPARLKVPLHRELESDIARQDILLTGAQLQAILFIDAHSRVVVEGGAGTGKTLVAAELAVRYAQEGRGTLLCCLSEALAWSLKSRIGNQSNLQVMTFSEARMAASQSRLGRFLAVIVDEAQDVDWTEWDLVEGCVEEGGVLRVFFDSNQAVYRARDDLETRLQANGVSLRLNLRNTKRIAAVTEPLYRGPLIQCAGAEGGLPLVIESSAEEGINRVLTIVRELVSGQSLAPGDVAVLAPDAKAVEKIRSELSRMGLKATDALTRASGAVIVETVARFKGLESLAVVLFADRMCANNAELAYVGVSRARALLVVIGMLAHTKLGNALVTGGSEQVVA